MSLAWNLHTLTYHRKMKEELSRREKVPVRTHKFLLFPVHRIHLLITRTELLSRPGTSGWWPHCSRFLSSRLAINCEFLLETLGSEVPWPCCDSGAKSLVDLLHNARILWTVTYSPHLLPISDAPHHIFILRKWTRNQWRKSVYYVVKTDNRIVLNNQLGRVSVRSDCSNSSTVHRSDTNN